jgi:dCTP deaminase
MILSDVDIREAISGGALAIGPFDGRLLQPAGVDLRLGDMFRVFRNSRVTHIDPRQEQPELTEPVTATFEEPFVLHPGEFALGCTVERVTIRTSDLVGRIEGKSSLGRLGLLVHSTAGYVDPGFSGQLTLELANVNILPILLYPGMPVCQLSLVRMQSPASRPYSGKYSGQVGPTPSRYYLNFRP